MKHDFRKTFERCRMCKPCKIINVRKADFLPADSDRLINEWNDLLRSNPCIHWSKWVLARPEWGAGDIGWTLFQLTPDLCNMVVTRSDFLVTTIPEALSICYFDYEVTWISRDPKGWIADPPTPRMRAVEELDSLFAMEAEESGEDEKKFILLDKRPEFPEAMEESVDLEIMEVSKYDVQWTCIPKYGGLGEKFYSAEFPLELFAAAIQTILRR